MEMDHSSPECRLVLSWICMSGVLEWPTKPGALITENPLEEAKPIYFHFGFKHLSLCLQDCPYTFSDSPAYLRQKKAKTLQPLASCCASSQRMEAEDEAKRAVELEGKAGCKDAMYIWMYIVYDEDVRMKVEYGRM